VQKWLSWWVTRSIIVSLIFAGLGFVLSTLDPLGLDHSSELQSRKFIGRAMAPLYGGHERLGQSSTSIVYLSEGVLTELREAAQDDDAASDWTWPPTYSSHTEMLQTLRRQGNGPKAIMLDFLFTGDLNDRSGFLSYAWTIAQTTKARSWTKNPLCHTTPAAKIACILDAGGTPVMLGKPSPLLLPRASGPLSGEQCALIADGAFPPELLEDVLHALDCVSVLTPVYFHDGASGYPLYIDYAEVNGAEMLKDKAKAEAAGFRAYDLSPAGAMYVTHFCLTYPSQCTVNDASVVVGQGAFFERAALKWMREPLSVQWGSRTPIDYQLFQDIFYEPSERPRVVCRDDAKERNSVTTFAAIMLRELADGLGDGAAKALRQPCPYTLEAPYSGVSRVTPEIDEVEARVESGEIVNRPPEVQRFRAALGGRYVWVGGRFINSTDWTDSPVHGLIPGVHWHAMAFDNLIEWGRNRLHDPRSSMLAGPLEWFNVDAIELIEFVVAVVLIFISILTRVGVNSLTYHVTVDPSGPLRPQIGRGVVVLFFAGSVLVQLAIIALVMWWVMAVLHYSPGNWLGLASLGLGVTAAWLLDAGSIPHPKAHLERTWLEIMASIPARLNQYFSFSHDRFGVHFREPTPVGALSESMEVARRRVEELNKVRELYFKRLESTLESEEHSVRELDRMVQKARGVAPPTDPEGRQ